MLALICVGFFACTKKEAMDIQECEDSEIPQVQFNPNEIPYDSLSRYGFFAGFISDQLPVEGVIPYELITPLFSDYAHKHRFI